MEQWSAEELSARELSVEELSVEELSAEDERDAGGPLALAELAGSCAAARAPCSIAFLR